MFRKALRPRTRSLWPFIITVNALGAGCIALPNATVFTKVSTKLRQVELMSAWIGASVPGS